MAVRNLRKGRIANELRDFLRALSGPVALVAWIYAPVWVALANGGKLSKGGVILSWLIPVLCVLAVLEIKFIASLD